ncbi:OmpA family protein [Lutimonas vermicola]|uniref:OmpA family protein n=1 Tax=Lutimonas vermicola TaxID=414288 RepID=A0ABU9KYM3_9FLAO
MKKLILFAMLGLFLQAPMTANAQILKKLKNKVDKTMDKGLDKAEDEIYGKNKDSKSEEIDTKDQDSESDTKSDIETLKVWSKYDFVPGETVIFEDNMEGEKNGEFPSQWDLKSGNVEIAKLGENTVINFPSTESGQIVPLMKVKGDYLPEVFTLEFDAYFTEFCTKYTLYLYDKVNQKDSERMGHIIISPKNLFITNYGSNDFEENKSYPYWQRIAISFNIRALKIYFGENRISNIPNFKNNPTGITISSKQCHQDQYAAIKNIRIATGNLELYDKMITDGKIITNGIRFDSGKATLKPESMGIINEIVKLMKQYPEIKFSIEGHTDSDGDEQFNKNLSEQRASTVVNTLIEQGIASARLESKGFGEEVPIADNSTPEGKANNRRVEFVKM